MEIDKASLRQELKAKRLSMSDAEHAAKSRQIVTRLKDLQDWSQFKAVHCFEPFKTLMEPDISGFMTYLEDLGVEVFVPRKIGCEWQMISIQKEGAPGQFDAIIVPVLGFDESMNRLGYGGGYYDRFLVTQTGARKIGVSFESGKAASLPVEDHDMPLNTVITEEKVY